MPRHLSADLATTRHVEPFGTGQPVDTVPAQAGQTVLLMGQNVSAYCGLFTVGAGQWQRHPDFAAAEEMEAGTTFYVRAGAEHQRTEWYLTDGVATVDSSPVYFNRRSYQVPIRAGGGLDFDPSDVSVGLREQSGVQGGYVNPAVSYDGRGIAVSVESGAFPEDHRQGLGVTFLSGASVEVGEGAAWIPGGDGALLTVDEPIIKSGLIPPANSMVYLYLWSNAGEPDIEFSTQAPASPYYGKARCKGGPDNTTPDDTPDDSRRLIYAFRTNASGQIIRFHHRPSDGFTRYGADQATTLRVVSGATNNAFADVDISPLLPVGAGSVMVAGRILNLDNPATLLVNPRTEPLAVLGGGGDVGHMRVGPTGPNTASVQQHAQDVALFGARVLRYRLLGVGVSRSADIDVLGYWMEV